MKTSVPHRRPTNRLAFRQSEQFTDYYPYGLPHPDAFGAEANRRKFGGKELLAEARYSSTAENAPDFSASYTHDLNGNITAIRQGGLAVGSAHPTSTMVRFTYSGNQLADFTLGFSNYSASEAALAPSRRSAAADGSRFAYDLAGNLTADPLRNISAIVYNVINRPCAIRGRYKGDIIQRTYSASGEKLAEHITSSDGLSDIDRRWIGPFEFTDGRLSRIHLPQGFLDTDSAPTTAERLHFYIPDHQGNILAVVKASTAQLEQFTDYYPYGQPHPDCVNPQLNNRLFSAKELTTALGINEYDFHARTLTLFGAFTAPDPLAMNYPWLSPYAYCASDPINFTDPSGMIIDTSLMTDEDRELYNKMVSFLSSYSEVLKTLFTYFNESSNIYYPTLSYNPEVDGVPKGGVTVFNDSGGATLYLKKNNETGEDQINSQEFIEEHFHCYQNENAADYPSSEANLEMEAKSFVIMAYPIGGNYNSLGGFNNDIRLSPILTDDLIKNLDNVESSLFVNKYYQYIPKFVNYYKENHENDPNYLKTGLVLPVSIIKLYKETYSK